MKKKKIEVENRQLARGWQKEKKEKKRELAKDEKE